MDGVICMYITHCLPTVLVFLDFKGIPTQSVERRCPSDKYAREFRECAASTDCILVVAQEYTMNCQVHSQTTSGVPQGCLVSSFLLDFVIDEVKEDAYMLCEIRKYASKLFMVLGDQQGTSLSVLPSVLS